MGDSDITTDTKNRNVQKHYVQYKNKGVIRKKCNTKTDIEANYDYTS